MNNIEFGLKENAVDSLTHGIEHYLISDEQRDLKYAVLHIAQAVELFLKEKLVREHYLLVFTKPENANEDSKTVTFEESIKRLKAANISFEPDAVDAFNKLQQYRNQIQHFKVNLEREEVTCEIGRALKYLESFLNKELDISVENEIDNELYDAYCKTVYTYDDLLKKAKDEIDAYLPKDKERSWYQITWCPACGNETIVYPDSRNGDDDIVECFFCKESFTIKECSRCGGLMFDETEESVCNDCWHDVMTSD
jgi:ribosomal protein S27E